MKLNRIFVNRWWPWKLVNVLYNRGSTNTLVLSKAVLTTGLQFTRQPKYLVRVFEGRLTTIGSCFFLPVLDTDGDKQVTRAYGVYDIATVALSRPQGRRRCISSGAGTPPLHGNGRRMSGSTYWIGQHPVAAWISQSLWQPEDGMQNFLFSAIIVLHKCVNLQVLTSSAFGQSRMRKRSFWKDVDPESFWAILIKNQDKHKIMR